VGRRNATIDAGLFGTVVDEHGTEVVVVVVATEVVGPAVTGLTVVGGAGIVLDCRPAVVDDIEPGVVR